MISRWRTWKHLWPWLLFAVATVIFHFKEILGERPFLRDTHLLFVPAKEFFAREWAAGRFAEWWPWSGLGAPLVAQPQFSFFHPSTLFYGVFPFWRAFLAQDFFATFSCLSGAYVLSRNLKHSRAIAAFVGVAYGLSGYLCGLSEFTFSKLAAGAIPWYLAALLFASRRSWATGAWAFAAMGCVLLCGDVQLALWAAALGVLFLPLIPVPFRRRATVWAVTAPLVGALLAAVQLLPSLAVAPYTERGMPMLDVRSWHLQVHHLLGLVLPLNHGMYDYVPSTYLSVAVMALAVSALWALKRRRVAVWALTALVAALIAGGDSLYLTPLLRKVVPLWIQFRYPIKSLWVSELCWVLMAGEALRLLQWPGVRKRMVATLMACSLASVALAAFWGPSGGFSSVILSVLLAVLMSVLVYRHSRWFPWAVAVFAAEMLSVKASWRATVDPSFYDEPPLARVLRAQGVGLRGFAFDRVDDRPRADSDYAKACSLGVGGADCSLNSLRKLPVLSPNQAGSSGRLMKLIAYNREAFAARMAGIFGVGFLVLREPLEAPWISQVIAQDPSAEYAVVKLPRVLPRAYALEKVKRAANAEESVAMMWNRSFLPGREVVLEGDFPNEWELRAPSVAREVTFPLDRRDSERVVLQTSLPAPGLVVLNEAWFPGWSAYVDGNPTPVFIANAVVRAVAVPEGSHQVVFEYKTPGLELGAWISMVSWLTVLAGALVFSRHQSRMAHNSLN